MSFVYNAVAQFLDMLWQSLGLSNKQGHLLLLGLDNAGKTTLLHRLRTGSVQVYPPTDRPHQESFRFGRIQFQAWDLGGHEAVRHLWQDYVSTDVSAVCFLIDAADTERLEEAAFELDALIAEKLLENLPVAILLNKCDLPEALPTREISARIEYPRLQRLQGEDKMNIFRISVLEGQGYQAAFQWISRFL